MSKFRLRVVTIGAILLLTAGASACTGVSGGETTINGQVTKIDTNARTFTVQTADGKTLDFKMVPTSKGDIMEIKEHYDLKKPVEVRYKPGTPPYEVTFGD